MQFCTWLYFAKAALKIGADNLKNPLDEIGFNQKNPFEITMTESQYSNTERIETEIQLANSGYGQGQILENPLHLARIYTSFLNDGRRMQNEDEFSKDELAMVYQYAAGTKEDTLAGLKEIVPVIRDRQTKEIVESTIRKLDAIPEPECHRFIADTKQRFIQKRDNSIRRRLAIWRHLFNFGLIYA